MLFCLPIKSSFLVMLCCFGMLLGSEMVAISGSARAQEIGFVETFALAPDRAEALQQLIPGTEEYYYYHALHFQNTQQFDQVETLLKSWIKRHGYTPQVRQIQNRQALLTYDQNPQKSLAWIRQQLGIEFNHQRQRVDHRPELPSELDPQRIAWQTLKQRAYRDYKNTDDFENGALDRLLSEKDLTPDRRRHLLSRIRRPDHPELVPLIAADLAERQSGGFGSLEIHRQLTLDQLRALVKLRPVLANQTAFVHAVLVKLQPGPDVDWRSDPIAHQAYLERLWKYVETLAPVHNSLKACVLYHRLLLDRSQGIYDANRFLAYIKLPRNAVYMNPEYLQRDESRRYTARLDANYAAQTTLAPVGNDESLVSSFLQHFLIKAQNTKAYAPYLLDTYLQRQFAETKIVHGLGEPEQWVSLLSPSEYQALKERVDLDFAYTNEQEFASQDEVSLELHVKHVRTLLVRVFEIDTENFYRREGREIDTDINLDGLVPNHEEVVQYDDAPLRRIKRRFDFPQMHRDGVYVVDFIGNGKSSRALIRKGKLRFLVRTGVAGQVFTVLDQQNKKLTDARLWIGGREYLPQKDGRIVVPLSNRPGRQPVVLSHGDLSSLDFFDHQGETYRLQTGIYVDRESLLKERQAKVVVRSGLTLNGMPVNLSLLSAPKLTIRSTDLDGVSTTKEVKDFVISDDRESFYEFQVPPRLAEIAFTLSARVKNLSSGKEETLSGSRSFSVNEIDRESLVDELHFSESAAGYFLELTGKTGETRPDRPIGVTLKHRLFKRPVVVTLKTDQRGRIRLGRLTDIAHVSGKTPEGTTRGWPLVSDQHTQYRSMQGVAGEPLRVPYEGLQKPTRNDVALLELRGGTYLQDRFDSIGFEPGYLVLQDLPAGDYELTLKADSRRITIRLASGPVRSGYVLGPRRHLELRGENPLQIARAEVVDGTLEIQLANSNEYARVHLFATQYEPPFSAFGLLSGVRDAEPSRIEIARANSLYIEGRRIGEDALGMSTSTSSTGNMPGNIPG